MASIAETFWEEILARIAAAPTFGVEAASIRRRHRTAVTRQDAPAIHVIEGKAVRKGGDRSCNWEWEMDGAVAVFVRDDLGLEAADPFVAEVVARINPEIGTPYSNGVRLEIVAIEPETEIADEDATRIDIVLAIKFGTKRWAIEETV